jgi:hypothetical protein
MRLIRLSPLIYPSPQILRLLSRHGQHHGDRAPSGEGSQVGVDIFAAGAAAVSAPTEAVAD